MMYFNLSFLLLLHYLLRKLLHSEFIPFPHQEATKAACLQFNGAEIAFCAFIRKWSVSAHRNRTGENRDVWAVPLKQQRLKNTLTPN